MTTSNHSFQLLLGRRTIRVILLNRNTQLCTFLDPKWSPSALSDVFFFVASKKSVANPIVPHPKVVQFCGVSFPSLQTGFCKTFNHQSFFTKRAKNHLHCALNTPKFQSKFEQQAFGTFQLAQNSSLPILFLQSMIS